MKILQVDYGLGAGGAETFVVDLCNELVKSNDVYFCCICSEDYMDSAYQKHRLSPNIKYVNLGSPKGVTISAIIRFLRLIKKINPDIIHGHLCNLYLIAAALVFPHKKIILTLHSVVQRSVGNGWQSKMLNYMFKNRRIIPVTISEVCSQSYYDYFSRHDDIKVDNGRSLPIISKLVDSVKKEIEGYKKHDDDKVFIHVGRYHKVKNQRMLIDVFNSLPKGFHYQLLIVGGWFEEEAPELINMANSNIHFLGMKNNVADYLSLSDFFVLSSLNEGMPITLLEALACKCIPICTPVGGIPNVITDKVTGFLSKTTSAEEYRKTVIEAYENYNNIDKENLLSEYKNRFSMEQCSKNYVKVYIDNI